MTRIKLCGLSRPCEIEAANELKPEYIGFVFAPKSKWYVMPEKARELKQMLDSGIKAVGVFVNERLETAAGLLNSGIIDLAQLHGKEDRRYIERLRELTGKPLIQAFQIETEEDIKEARESAAEYILLDSGAGTGTTFDWRLAQKLKRQYFLAGGLTPGNVGEAVRILSPFAVDVSSGVETDGYKNKAKMAAFAAAVRKEDAI